MVVDLVSTLSLWFLFMAFVVIAGCCTALRTFGYCQKVERYHVHRLSKIFHLKAGSVY